MAPPREKIGQMFMIGLQGESLTRDEQLVIEECGFGGFILFSHNCCGPEQILSLSRSLWESNPKTPPLIGIDQEGGRVHRLANPFTHFPAAALVGRKDDPNLAYRAARATAAELALVGVNLNFIIPCGKHFPGHGGTDKDSYLDLPVLDRSPDELTAVELPPFVHACRNQIESLMTAHVLYRSLDPNFPATLSPNIVTGLLRQQLGYAGVVFSDDMEMKALSSNYDADEAVALAVRAGVDVMLYCHDLPGAVNALEFLCSEAERNPAVRAQVENSYHRITELKQRYLKRFTGIEEKELAKRLARLDHRRIVNEISE